MTSQQYQTSLFEDSEVWTLSVEDFRARLSQLRDTDEVLKIHEELCSLKSVGSHLFSDLNIYSLKTSEDSSIMTGGATFETIIRTLDGLGYDVEWQVLNSKNFGVPQNRERVFIIGHLRGERTRNVFPIGRESEQSDRQQSKIEIVGNTKNPNGTSQGTGSVVYDSNGLIGTLCARDYKEPKQVAIPVLTPDRAEKRQNGRRFKTDGEPMFTLTAQDRHGVVVENKVKQVGNLIDTESFGGNPHRGRVYDIRGISPCLNCMGGGGREPKIRVKEATSQGYAEAEIGDSVNLSHPNSKTRRGRVGKQIANTLLTGESQGVVEPDFRIRKLTPRECWRLQGFPDWAFDKAQEVNSNSQLYKQAGNSVTVNVIEVIAREL